jgi:hypothetical protein
MLPIVYEKPFSCRQHACSKMACASSCLSEYQGNGYPPIPTKRRLTFCNNSPAFRLLYAKTMPVPLNVAGGQLFSPPLLES